MNIYDLFKSIYIKDGKFPETITLSECIAITRWISRDRNNIANIKRILPYLFYISPENYFCLLYFNIPKKYPAPVLRKIDRFKSKDNAILNKIKYILNWSERELELNRHILEKTILSDSKYWKKELGL